MAEKSNMYGAGNLSGLSSLKDLNPAQVPEEDINKWQVATEQGMKALENRYATPNWFKVAAGFAKPQLGGFTASLGSAMDAMGDTVEQQRENMIPVTQMKQELELSKIFINQKKKQNEIFQKWKESGRPMDEHTFTEIQSLGDKTPIAAAAKGFWDETQKRLTATGTAAELASKYPELDANFKGYIDQASNPFADPEILAKRRAEYDANLANAKPPQIEAATWNGMSREQKQDAAYKYAEAQQKIGLTEEGKFKVAHDQALPRLARMETIRDLALGKGLQDITITGKDGKPMTLNGQQQMERMLGMFGGSNPIEAIAKAVNEGRLGALLANSEPLVRQLLMNPDSRREFESLTKLLAAQNIEYRNGAVNPTNAYQELQSTGQPNIGNQQDALIAIMDMMAHTERNHINNYMHILQNPTGGRHIGTDEKFIEKQAKYAKEYTRIPTVKVPYNTPYFYRSSEEPRRAEEPRPNTNAAPAAPAATATEPAAPAAANTSRTSAPQVRSPNTTPRRDTMVGLNGNIYKRDANGHWKDTGEKP